MDSIKQKNSAKAAVAGAVGVGVGAAYAGLQDQTPVANAQNVLDNVAEVAPAQQAVEAAAAEPAHVEELVQAYLGGDQAGVINADALTAADIADMLPEPAVLDALASYSGVEAAQAGGSGAAAGGIEAAGGIGPWFASVGNALGVTGAGAAFAGGAAVFGGAALAGYGIDQAVNGC